MPSAWLRETVGIFPFFVEKKNRFDNLIRGNADLGNQFFFSNPCLEGCLAAAKSDHGLLIRDLIVVSTNATIHQKSLATFEKNVGHRFVSKSSQINQNNWLVIWQNYFW